MALDDKSKEPLYLQLYEILKEEIESSMIAPGEQIPTEAELIDKYNVSRITVRNALKKLTEDNYVVRYKGKGSFVPDKQYKRSLNSTQSFSEMCRELGYKPGAHVIKCCIEDASKDDIVDLGLKEGAKVVVVERLRFADGTPVSLEITHFTEDFDFLLQENLNDCSMYEIIRDKYNIIFSSSRKILELKFANYEWAKYLGVPDNFPLLSINSVVSTTEGKKAQRSQQLIVGTKFKLLI